jgi:hypothetical protein
MACAAMIGTSMSAACGETGGSEGNADSGDSSGGTGSATASGTSSASTSASSSASTSAATSASSTTVATTGETESSTISDTSATDSTTGELPCGLSEKPGQDGPWFDLGNLGEPLGATLTMECGGQGALMFFLQTDQGGFLPVDDYVMYDVTFDVPGFDDLSPTGHFYEAQGYPVYVGCGGIGEPDGGFNTVGIAMLLPDALTDVHMVDGVEATLHVSLLPPDDEPVVFDATVTLAVPQYLSLDTCGFGV